jgi:putative flippase GtrA
MSSTSTKTGIIERLRQLPAARRLVSHIPPAQFGRYLAVGVWNTAFGYLSYALLTAALTPRIPYAYILAAVLSGFLNITLAFLNYKLFIFKTKGNYLREWFRCVLVYSSGIAIGTALLPPTVFLLRHFTTAIASAPYIAGAFWMGLNVISGFLGHKNFSFAPPQPARN